MKTTRIIFTLALATALNLALGAAYSWAEVEKGKWSGGFRVNGVMPEDPDIDNGAGLSGYVAYPFADYARVEIETGWRVASIDLLGDIHTFPLLANFQWFLPNESEWTPYVTTGLGMLFFNFDESDLVDSVGATIDIDPAFAIKLGGGFDYSISDTMELNMDAGYIMASSEADLTQGSTTLDTDDIEHDHWSIGAGFRVFW